MILLLLIVATVVLIVLDSKSIKEGHAPRFEAFIGIGERVTKLVGPAVCGAFFIVGFMYMSERAGEARAEAQTQVCDRMVEPARSECLFAATGDRADSARRADDLEAVLVFLGVL